MSRSTLRRIRHLKADYAPIIAERERRKSEQAKLLLVLAEAHLLRIIAVFRYGEPRIDEPLAHAYRRALSKLGNLEVVALDRLRGILEKEAPAGDIKSKIFIRVQEVPDWLRYFCRAWFSMDALGAEGPRFPSFPKHILELKATESDEDQWPFLPQGVIEPGGGDQTFGKYRCFFNKMSQEELLCFLKIIHWRAKEEWTRRERKFVRAMFDRYRYTLVTDH